MSRGTSDDPSPSEVPRQTTRLTRQRNLGALRHRALMLAMQGRHAQAARLLLDELGVTPTEVKQLGPEARRLVSIAATYLEKAGAHAGAADLFQALGEDERAAISLSGRALEQRQEFAIGAGEEGTDDDSPPTVRVNVEPLTSTQFGPARTQLASVAESLSISSAPRRSRVLDEARAMVKEGKGAAAAAQLSEHGLHYEAAVCLIKASDLAGAIAHLLRVPNADAQYPVAARTMTRVLCRLAICDGQHLRFLRDFVDAGPADDDQAELFVKLAELVATTSGDKQAETILRAILRRIPDHAAATERLERVLAAGGAVTVSVPGVERPTSASTAPPPAPSSVDELTIGMVVANRFRVDAEIGRGGMATVYSAHDLELDEQVALKVFAGQLITPNWQQEAMERFRLELKVCRKLRHPNIIQVYDIGVFAGHRYFTMELLRGYSLDRLLGEPVEVAWGLECLIQAATGLYAAHEEGVVHRDVKPENLFVTDDGVVKVMDFGIAKSSYQPGKTQIGTLAGTPEYMAPEQINNFSLVGPAADQYSLGCVAYQMFTGSVPFASEQLMAVLMAHIERPPTPPSALNPTLPTEIEAVILRMLAKQPLERFATLWDLAEELARLRE